MRSLEKSHKNTDIDQVDPEHIRRETAEFSWDDLNSVPFKGNEPRDVVKETRDLKELIDSLPTDGGEEASQSAEAEKARQQVLSSFDKMKEGPGSFGKAPRDDKGHPLEKPSADHSDFDKELSDISASF